MSKLESVVFATERLLSPAAPGVLALVGAYEPDVDALRKAVDVDPMLTVKVINEANKSYYSRKVPVQSVRRALVRLGWKTSREVLTALLVQAAASHLPPRAGSKIWGNAKDVATIARQVAKVGGKVNAELAYTTGLTHSLGALGLLALHQEGYAGALMKSRSNLHLAVQERKAFGYDHASVGAGVLHRMVVPKEMVDAVNWQYQAKVQKTEWNDNPSMALAGTLQFCHWVTAQLEHGVPDAEAIAAQTLADRLGLGGASAAEFRDRLTEALAEDEEAAA